MKRSLALVVIACVLATPLVAETAGRYIVVTTPSFRHRQVTLLQSEAPDANYDVREFQTIDAFAATLTESQVAALRKSPGVRYVSPVVERHLLDASPMPMQPATESVYQRQQVVSYGVGLVHARDTWFATQGENANIAIIDTGIDANHPDLAGVYAGGYNTFNPNTMPVDDNRHGTHVTGIVAAQDNNVGVLGVAPKARVWMIKALDKDGNGTDETLIHAIDWVVAKKAAAGGNWIISMSLGGKQSSPAESDAIQKALDANILIVAAAGNTGFSILDFPASYPGVLAVGAVDGNEQLASFSNRGPRVDIVAPGVKVPSTVPVGFGIVSEVVTGSESLNAAPLTGSPKGSQKGPIVYCGLGQTSADFPPEVSGKIAFIRRGEITFNQKVRNAKAAGAIAVIIGARDTDSDDPSRWTLIRPCDVTCDDNAADLAFAWPLTLAMTYADGEKARAASGNVEESFSTDDYAVLSGTSMATPHVSAVAALVWSLAPSLKANDLKVVLESTAVDLGSPGVDDAYGYGLVDALAAAKKVAPTIFGLPEPPPPPSPGAHRRASH